MNIKKQLQALVDVSTPLGNVSVVNARRLQAIIDQLPDLEQQVKELECQLLGSQENTSYYKAEWESACERDRYGQEQLKEAQEKNAALERKLIAIEDKTE